MGEVMLMVIVYLNVYSIQRKYIIGINYYNDEMTKIDTDSMICDKYK